MAAQGQWVDFATLKEQADFAAVLAYFDFTPKRQGNDYVIPCPFHEGSNQNCKVDVDGTKGFRCFGCAEHGNVIDFARRVGGLSLIEAAELVASVSGIDLPMQEKSAGGAQRPVTGRKASGRTRTPKRTQNASQAAQRRSGGTSGKGPAEIPGTPLSAAFLERFEATLDREHPYLPGRIGAEAMQTFAPCGYKAAGLMKNRAVVPWRDPEGRILAFVGRWVDEEVPDDEGKYKLPSDFPKRRLLWNLERVREARWLVVVEGIFDAIRLERLGYPAIALVGTSLSPEQADLLQTSCPNLKLAILMLDGDDGGREGADKAAPILMRRLAVRAVDLPEGADPETVDEAFLHAALSPIFNSGFC